METSRLCWAGMPFLALSTLLSRLGCPWWAAPALTCRREVGAMVSLLSDSYGLLGGQ